jgi:hypothetical protein
MRFAGKSVTVIGLILAAAAWFMDPTSIPFVAEVFGEQAATKLAAIGAMVAGLGSALFGKTPPRVPREPIVPEEPVMPPYVPPEGE